MKSIITIVYPEKEFCSGKPCKHIKDLEYLEQTLKLNMEANKDKINKQITEYRNGETGKCDICDATQYRRFIGLKNFLNQGYK